MHVCFLSAFSFQIIGRPTSTYMEKVQQDIKQNMRGILVDWLAEVYNFSFLTRGKK